MIRDITIGQYYPSNSYIHNLDPRVKLFGTLIYIISLFLIKNLYGYLIIVPALVAMIYVSKVPVGYVFRGIKPILLLLVITVFFNVFFIDGKILFQMWIFRVSEEGIIFAIFMAMRLILLIFGTSMMTFTTTPNELTDGLEKSLSFLKVIKVPVHEIAMMMAIALRFIPILLEEVDKIMKAQSARGAVFDEGGILNRIKAMIPILVPLFFSAFRRADDLTMAMDSRCYVCGRNRTKMKPLRYKKNDYISYGITGIYLLVIILYRSLV